MKRRQRHLECVLRHPERAPYSWGGFTQQADLETARLCPATGHYDYTMMMMMVITTMVMMMNGTVLVRIQIDISSNKHDNQSKVQGVLALGWLGSEEPPKV